ncbi:MAG: urease accessory protein UreE [Nostocales cyanobacterium]|nr:MAG: urease accessory protein UreE [Nostocales cyanobacterium]
MITLTKLKPNIDTGIDFILPLTAEERTRSRYKFTLDDHEIFLRLPRGTVLQDGDILTDENDTFLLKIVAKPEPVLTVFASTPSLLLRAAYHLGNRHVPVEITVDYLRLLPDSVLENMLKNMGLEIKAEIVPFQPESGAYGNHHSH